MAMITLACVAHAVPIRPADRPSASDRPAPPIHINNISRPRSYRRQPQIYQGLQNEVRDKGFGSQGPGNNNML